MYQHMSKYLPSSSRSKDTLMDVQHHRLRKRFGLVYSTVSVSYKTIHKKPLRSFAHITRWGKGKYSVDLLDWAYAQLPIPCRSNEMFKTRTKALSYCLQISERLRPDD